MLLGVDVGGTFTDAVLALDGRIVSAKAPTTASDQSEGVMAAVEAVLERAGRPATDVASFSHGMTVATNALLEGRGARTALIATEGFTDLVALGRQDRAELYRLCAGRPAPLVPDELRFPAPERMAPEGPLRPIDGDGLAELVARVKSSGVESVAVVLLHSYRFPEHERAIGEALRTAMPGTHVSLSHEVVGTFREFERAATTEIDAALSPLLSRYLRRLVERTADEGLPNPAIMQSNGGLIDIEAAANHAAWTVLSGPAGGAAGAAFVARASEQPDALCLDMGGTSCDVCVVEAGVIQERGGSSSVADRPLALPMVAIHTVGAGGGSIAWRDAGGALRVGPQSAGAEPGPACYARGGNQPTVTDANLVLGYLSSEAPLAGGVALDRGAAERAVAKLGGELGLDCAACAEGIVRVANAEMVRALRVVTVQRGIDPRRFALLAFGGAGPLHAAQIAEELEIETIICPRSSGVLAALGLVISPRRRDVQRSLLLSGDALTAEAITGAVDDLAGQARRALGSERAELDVTYEVRYRGQSFELTLRELGTPTVENLRGAFEAQHEERYGYRDPALEVELVTLRVSAMVPAEDVTLASANQDESATRERRPATISGQQIEIEVLAGSFAAGTPVAGPAVVELPESTLLVPPDWTGELDAAGTIRLTRARAG